MNELMRKESRFGARVLSGEQGAPGGDLVDPAAAGALRDPLMGMQTRYTDTLQGAPVGAIQHPSGPGGGGTSSRTGQQGGTSGTADTSDPFTVGNGQLTFDAEGQEGGRYHTRTAHWPGGASGVTIGRGYDLGQRGRKEILAHMEQAGIAAGDAAKFARAAGLKGARAKAFLRANKDLPEITPAQQKVLFDIVYGELAADVERISGNYAKSAGRRSGNPEDFEVDWDNLDPVLRDLVVDLRYRGDYTPATRKKVQPLLIDNDVEGMKKLMADRDFWKGVPNDRFERRMDAFDDIGPTSMRMEHWNVAGTEEGADAAGVV